MLGFRFGDHQVFLYASMLHTRGLLLKELYCESHREEPWAVRGDTVRQGTFLFPASLYVVAAEREALLREIPERLERAPGYAWDVERRLELASRAALAGVRAIEGGDRAPDRLEATFRQAARMLAAGVFKEAFEPPAAGQLLGRYLPERVVRAALPALYQPRCLPHFLKMELKLLHSATAYARQPSPGVVRAAMSQAGWLGRFLMEPAPLESFDVMEDQLRQMGRSAGGGRRLAARRRQLLERHRAALGRAEGAQHLVLSALLQQGRASYRAHRVVRSALRMISVISTYEELKHMLSLRTARAFGVVMNEHHLPLEGTDLAALLRHLRSRSSISYS